MTKPFVKHSVSQMDDSEIIYLAEEVEKDTFSDILNFERRILCRGFYRDSKNLALCRMDAA